MILKRISIIFVCLLFLLNSVGCGADKDEISLRNESEYVTEAYSQPESTTINENEAEFPDESVSAEESASADISKASDKSTLSDTHTNTSTEAKTKAATEVFTKSNSSGWVEAYRAYLLELTKVYSTNSGNQFALIFIDSDNIPELVVTDGPGAHGYGYTVLVYKDGKTVESAYLGSDSFWYYPKKSIFGHSGSGGAGSGGKTFYRLEGTQSIAIDKCEYEYSEEYPETPKYTINDVEVSENEYNLIDERYAEKYGREVEFSGFPLTESSVINNCK